MESYWDKIKKQLKADRIVYEQQKKETTAWEAGLIKEEKMKTIDQQIKELQLSAGDECIVDLPAKHSLYDKEECRFIILNNAHGLYSTFGRYQLHRIHDYYVLNGTDVAVIKIGFRKWYTYDTGCKDTIGCKYTEVLPKKEQTTVQEQLITLGMQEGDLVVLDGYPGTFLVVTEYNTPFIRVGDLNVTGINARRIKVKKAFRLDRNPPIIRYTMTGIRQEYREVEVD